MNHQIHSYRGWTISTRKLCEVKLGIISPSSTTGSNKQKNETTTSIRIHLQSQFDRKYLHHDKRLIYQNDLILFWGLKQIKRHWILNLKLPT